VSPLGHCHVVVARQFTTAVPPQACPPREGATPVQSTRLWRSMDGVGFALRAVSEDLEDMQMGKNIPDAEDKESCDYGLERDHCFCVCVLYCIAIIVLV
jgi:hypothetical protein